MIFVVGCAHSQAHTRPTERSPIMDHTVTTLAGKTMKLSEYRGKALLIVNTASECGFTPQYAELEKLYQQYKDRGFLVLGFPSNDFGAQEPGTSEDIQNFCEKNYGVSFPMFDKIHARGPEISPVYKTLTTETPQGIAGDVKWNFTKFLVDPKGKVVARFEPNVKPLSPEVTKAIEGVLP
jgi:glutathione peroxidase